jgi:hypothetical protein
LIPRWRFWVLDSVHLQDDCGSVWRATATHRLHGDNICNNNYIQNNKPVQNSFEVYASPTYALSVAFWTPRGVDPANHHRYVSIRSPKETHLPKLPELFSNVHHLDHLSASTQAPTMTTSALIGKSAPSQGGDPGQKASPLITATGNRNHSYKRPNQVPCLCHSAFAARRVESYRVPMG